MAGRARYTGPGPGPGCLAQQQVGDGCTLVLALCLEAFLLFDLRGLQWSRCAPPLDRTSRLPLDSAAPERFPRLE